MKRVLLSRSPSETEALGEGLAGLLCPGDVLALCGGLGAGKTCFIRGVARGLGVKESLVASPSFTLVNEYPGRIPLYHIDFYRLRGVEDVDSIGFWEYLDSDGVVAVEWADRVPEVFPEGTLWVELSFRGEGERAISFEGKQGRAKGIVEALGERG